MSGRLQRIRRVGPPITHDTDWPGHWRLAARASGRPGLLNEIVKKASPEWVDRCWLQIGLIQESAGRLPEAVEAFSTLERVAPRVPSGKRGSFTAGWGCGAWPLGRSGGTVAATGCKGAGIACTSRRLELATIELASKRPDEAVSTIRVALERYPKCPAAPALQFRWAEALKGRSGRRKPRRGSSRWPRNFRTTRGPTTPCFVRPSRAPRGDSTSARKLAEAFRARFHESALRHEWRD